MNLSFPQFLRLLVVGMPFLPRGWGQSCTDQSCTSNCAQMDTPIIGCLGHWQSRGKSSLSQCVCMYHDHTVAILQECVACDNPNLVVSQKLGVYQAWLVICSEYMAAGENAAVGLEQDGINGLLVPVFSQSFLGPVQTQLCGAAATTTYPTTTTRTTTSPDGPTPTPNSAERNLAHSDSLLRVLAVGVVAQLVVE